MASVSAIVCLPQTITSPSAVCSSCPPSTLNSQLSIEVHLCSPLQTRCHPTASTKEKMRVMVMDECRTLMQALRRFEQGFCRSKPFSDSGRIQAALTWWMKGSL
jgi:hypothetical protein